MDESPQTPTQKLWNLVQQGKTVPIADIPALKLISDATRTGLIYQGVIPAVKVFGRWHSDEAIVIAAMKAQHENRQESTKTRSRKPAEKRFRTKREVQAAGAIDHLASIGITQK